MKEKGRHFDRQKGGESATRRRPRAGSRRPLTKRGRLTPRSRRERGNHGPGKRMDCRPAEKGEEGRSMAWERKRRDSLRTVPPWEKEGFPLSRKKENSVRTPGRKGKSPIFRTREKPKILEIRGTVRGRKRVIPLAGEKEGLHTRGWAVKECPMSTKKSSRMSPE